MEVRSNTSSKSTTEIENLCFEVSRSLRETGALIFKDPRCSASDNDRFLDMMESYFQKSLDLKLLQQRPNLHYQVGATPEGVEIPRSLVDEEMQQKIKMMPKESQPSPPVRPDPKWRYTWRVGPRPTNTRFQELNSEPVVPEGFPEWKETMDAWGSKMISAIEVDAEMAAIAFGLPRDAFTSLMEQEQISWSYIWLRNGQKVEVKVPVGFLIIQAGKQREWLTGGEFSSYFPILLLMLLKPLGHFVESPLSGKLPAICAGEYVEQDLAVINLKGKQGL